jgi:DNA-binding MarR family transcriptional regulator
MEGLNDAEEQILRSLAESGALTPSEISVKTLIMPDEVDSILKTLGQKGLVKSLSLAQQPQSVEPEACTLTPEGRRALKA